MARRRPSAQSDPRLSLTLPEVAVLYAHAQLHASSHRWYHDTRLQAFVHTHFIKVDRYHRQMFRLLTPAELITDFTQRNSFHPPSLIARIDMLTDHIPSSPFRLPVLDIWATLFDQDDRQHHFSIVCYSALYAGHRYVTDITEGHRYHWVNDTTIELTAPNGWRLQLKSARMEEIIEFTPTKEQSQFRFEYPDSAVIRRLNNFHNFDNPPATPILTPAAATPATTVRTERTDRHKTRKAPTATDATTVAQIADSLGIPSNLARNILRKANTPKPASGRWEYTDPTDIANITAILAKGMKK